MKFIKNPISITLLFLCVFGYSQTKLLPNGDDYYHSYSKANDTVRIYDIGDNLVREAYLKQDRAVDFYNETIFWTHLESRYLLERNKFIKPANTVSYLYTKEIESEILSGGENGRLIHRPYIVSTYGFNDLNGSEDNYMDNPLNHTDYMTKNYSNAKKSSNTEILKSKYQPETKIIRKYNEKENIHSCIFYSNDVKHLELFIRFNNQGLISDLLYIKTYSRGAKDESKNMWLKKMQYDDLGNIIEEKEWRFKDTNQVENFITEKGEDLFLSVIFENPANYL
ncbi:hypothetical protein I2486_19710, partial [Cellulophaga sp. E16_2]|uniref:hypothetical protein n=1 Tax=Cellulophaga sp. E16_2 TaxID=2789297 RepID=UPI001A914EAB